MKRQGLITSIKQLRKVANELEKDSLEHKEKFGVELVSDFQINIINKTPGCSDTWEIEE